MKLSDCFFIPLNINAKFSLFHLIHFKSKIIPLTNFILSEIDSRIGIQAQHILHQINGTSYREIIPVIDEEQEEIARTVQRMEVPTETITIYPNPVANYSIITVILENASTNSKLIISNVTGNQILSYELGTGANYIEINNSNLTQGIYIAYVQNNKSQTITSKFIVIQ